MPILVLLFAMPLQAAPWQVYTHSLEQQASQASGELRGLEHGGKRAFYLELVRTLLHDLGEPVKIVEVPLARGLMLAQSRAHVVLFNLSRTEEREAHFRWIGPTLNETDYLYELRASPTGIRQLADAQDMPICVLNGGLHESMLSKQKFSALQRSNSYSGCFRMLAANRVSLVATSSSDLLQKVESAGITADDVQPSAVSLGQDQGYIALSLDTPEVEVQRWQAALEKLQLDGRYQQLYMRYVQ
ncbi:MAG TPA: transporter substrate-binding domain-containing protein [Pseudomonas sp.]|nr:transporter substrate-binding domain-containing protein [Pseudomonas sp.]